MLLSDRIKALAPANAVSYRLKLKHTDGTVRTFPPNPGAFFELGESPYGMPNATYFLCFYDEENRPISHPERRLNIDVQDELPKPSQAQLSMSFMNAQREPAAPRPLHPAGPKSRGMLEPPGKSDAPSEAPESTPSTPSDPEDSDLEFRRYLHAMDVEERQQEFIKNSTYVTEVGELFALARMSRREILELQLIIVTNAQQAYRDAEQMKRGVRDLFQLQQEVLAAAAAQIGRPPTPPPDYVGLGHSALSLLKEISVAVIQRTSGRAPNNTLQSNPSGKSAAQLQAPGAELSPGGEDPPSARLEQMVRHLKGLSDLEMATAMSSQKAGSACSMTCRPSPRQAPQWRNLSALPMHLWDASQEK